MGSRRRLEVVKLHDYLPLACFLFERDRQILYWLRFGRTYGSPSTATRKFTALSIPRTAGLSGSSRVWFMRRKPSDCTVAFTDGMAPMGLFLSVALRVFLPAVTSYPPAWLRRRRRLRLPGVGTRWPGDGRRSARPLCRAAPRPAEPSAAA